MSLDLKDAPAVDIVSALAEVGRLQVVFDPGPACSLTLKVRQVRWRVAFESALRAHAAEMAPIVKRLLAPRGDVVYDARTNTLIIVD